MRNYIVKERSPNSADLTAFLLGLEHTKRCFRTDALKGRRAVVFGALWHSIGAACAAMLAEFGCELVVVQGESEEAVGPTFEYLQKLQGAKVEKLVADLSISGSGAELANHICEQHPGIDICLYIPGLSWYPAHTGYNPADVAKMVQVNWLSMCEVSGVFLTQHLLRRAQNPEARLDLGACSSIQALVAAADNAGIYSGTKAAVEQSLRNLGVQYARQGVHTHCVAPGCVDTARHRSTDHEFGATRDIGEQTPWGELAPPSVIAEAFLASICAPNYRVGQLIVVDGGWSAAGNVNARGQNKQ